MKKIMVTGGYGFIGTNLVKQLLADTNYSVVVFDNFCITTKQKTSVFDSDRVTVVQGDIRNSKMVQYWMKDCDIVINLAAQCGVQESIADPVSDASVNVMGLANLLMWAYQYKIPRFIHASSFAVNNTRSFYALNKQVGEQYLQLFSELHDMETIALRFSNVYGPFSDHKSSVIAKWIRQYKQKQPLTIWGDGTHTRDFVYVGDVAEVIMKAIDTPLPKHHMVLPVCTGIGTMVQTVADCISSNQIVEKELPPGDGESVIVDSLVTRELFDVGLNTLVCEKVQELIKE